MMKSLLCVTVMMPAMLLLSGCSTREKTAGSSNKPDAAAAKNQAKEQNVIEDPKAPQSEANPVVIIETSMGAMRAELWPGKSPATVANFLRYTDEEFFDGLIFHRVIDGFMVQGGGFDPQMRQKRTHGPIQNEAAGDVRNDRATLAMARTSDIHSATAQFFINLKDNDFLNQRDKTPDGFGYCAFGRLIDGLDVLDRIGKVKTHTHPTGPDDVPVEPVVIQSVRRAK